ncbi:uncharacterized protein [Watersipora subatra]|uniref:uncharacterized protein n=1 Tax=Watersipora subatra TaxID=2589382 RepID=UPI00355C31C1
MKLHHIIFMGITTALLIAGTNGQGTRRGPYKRLPQFDELLAEAGNFDYRGKNAKTGRSLDTDIYTSDGKNVLFELDELEPVPCELERADNNRRPGATLVQADSAVGAGSCVTRRGPRRRGRGNELTGTGGNFRRNSRRGKRAATSDTSLRWPSTTIAYRLSAPASDPFEQTELDAINAAVAEYARYTCINLVPRTSEENYIEVIRDGGCYSSIGWIYWDQPNRLSLARGCASAKNIPIHEFMHALGIWHQQSRPDRDQHVMIINENILGGTTHNFFKLEPDEAVTAGTEYSYRSVMHYGRNAFSVSRELDTVVTKDPAYQDIIGRATTFSFEDLQLINHIYKCDQGCSNTCPLKSYRDRNCNCYCPNGSNYDEPAVLCSEVNECNMIGVSCNCGSRSNACSGLANTACSTNSGACECDAASGLIDGQCIRVEDAECTEVGQNCLCSRKSTNACSQLSNTQCNSGTNACECRSGHMLNPEGVCENINIPCNRIGEACFCSQKSNACGSLANSYCDLLTDRCECDEDFYVSPRAPGVCTRAPACTAVGSPCMCSVQGTDACTSLPGTQCDTAIESCVCMPSYELTPEGTCEPSLVSYISDGSSVAPFLRSSLTTPNNQFTPDAGDEPANELDRFGVELNGYRLRSVGRGANRYGVIETPVLPAGTWCVQYSYKMQYGAIWVQTSTDGINWRWRGVGANWVMRRWFRKELVYFTSDQLFVRFQAEMHPSASANEQWEVLLDPVVVKRC